MEEQQFHSIEKSDKSYCVERTSQPGFSSPATHYSEPRIDFDKGTSQS